MLYAFDLLEFDGEDLRALVRKCRRKKVVLETVLLQRMGQEAAHRDGRHLDRPPSLSWHCGHGRTWHQTLPARSPASGHDGTVRCVAIGAPEGDVPAPAGGRVNPFMHIRSYNMSGALSGAPTDTR
jgi:hypothetical protein